MSQQKDLRHEANLQGMRLLMASKDERIAKLEALVAERDAMLGKRPCQSVRCNELNEAQALSREILDGFDKFTTEMIANFEEVEWGGLMVAQKIRNHLAGKAKGEIK